MQIYGSVSYQPISEENMTLGNPSAVALQNRRYLCGVSVILFVPIPQSGAGVSAAG